MCQACLLIEKQQSSLQDLIHIGLMAALREISQAASLLSQTED